MRAQRGIEDLAWLRRQSDQVIERHHDLGAERGLNVYGAFWSEHVERTVNVGTKTDPILCHLGLLRE